jgi:hypothetical protein
MDVVANPELELSWALGTEPSEETCDTAAPAPSALRADAAPRRCSPPWNRGATPHRCGGAHRRHRVLAHHQEQRCRAEAASRSAGNRSSGRAL